jgi:hypothetical protein
VRGIDCFPCGERNRPGISTSASVPAGKVSGDTIFHGIFVNKLWPEMIVSQVLDLDMNSQED